jgi:hypothetical protein
MMKNIITLTLVAVICLTSFLSLQVYGQTSSNMNYQAVIRDVDDNLVANQQIGIQLSILQGAPDGTPVYVEQHNPTTNANGLVTVEIGNGSVVSGDYSSINWTEGPYFLKSETDPTGGSDYSISGTSPLLSVPYALHARVADSIVNGGTETDPVFSESVAFGITEADTANWNSKLSTEVDGDITNELQLLDIVGQEIFITEGNSIDLPDETDPVFGASVASGITTADTANWNHHTDSTDIANMGFTAYTSITQNMNGQIVISDTGGTTPHPAAMLDLQSNTGGLYLPRMTFGEMFAIPNPPTGLLVLESNTGAIFVRTPSAWSVLTNADNLEIDALNDAQVNSSYNSYYIGTGSGTGFSEAANFTTAVGNSSGIGFGDGDFNTAIGATAGPASGTTDLHHTTTLGYGATAEASHQVVLGRSDDTVIIPRSIRIKAYAGPTTGHLGKLYVEESDSSLYYHDGNNWSQVNDRYQIGDFAMGGIVYYVDETGKHGLVCYPSDVESAVRWADNIDNVTYAKGDGIYAGQMNTVIAIAALGSKGDPSAVQSCASATASTPFTTDYGDWYLPSKEELLLMYNYKDAINATINSTGHGTAIGADQYWSSSEHPQVVNEAWVIDFSSGLSSQQLKDTQHHARPVRKF